VVLPVASVVALPVASVVALLGLNKKGFNITCLLRHWPEQDNTVLTAAIIRDV
jgi:hypothetical protein